MSIQCKEQLANTKYWIKKFEEALLLPDNPELPLWQQKILREAMESQLASLKEQVEDYRLGLK